MTDTAYIDESILSKLSMFELCREYNALLARLYEEEVNAKPKELNHRLQAKTEILVHVVQQKQVLATAQGSLADGLPHQLVIVHNVVTYDDHEGQACWQKALSALEAEAVFRWGKSPRPLKALLTSQPNSGNDAFYERNGWYPLTPAGAGMTRLWQKDLHKPRI